MKTVAPSMVAGIFLTAVGFLLSSLAPAAPQLPRGEGRPGAAEAKKPPDPFSLKPRQALSLRGHKKDVWRAAFTPDGKRIISGDDAAQVIVWDALGGRELVRFHQPDQVHGVCCIQKKGVTYLATASMTPYPPGFSGRVVVQAFAKDGKLADRAEFAGADRWCFSCVALTVDGAFAAAGGADRAVRVWSLQKYNFRREGRNLVRELIEVNLPAPALPAPIWSVAFHPSQPLLAASCEDGSIRLFDVATTGINPATVKIDGHNRGVTCVAFSPDGTQLASASHDGTVRLWDIGNGRQVRELKASAGLVEWVSWSPDGTLLATAQADNLAKLWDAATGKELAVLTGHTSPVLCASFSPDGKRLATASRDFSVRVWDLYEAPPKQGARK